ncbi:MAG: hypothetical protein JWO64_3127 [Hyphomicrobiales bacterium]|nr:hypothetical protein [Hyphomicrobiales bacterium]
MQMWRPFLWASVSSALFALLSLIIASLVKTRERFMGIGQMITMPMLRFAVRLYRAGGRSGRDGVCGRAHVSAHGLLISPLNFAWF